MKNRDLTSPGQEQQHPGGARPGGGAPSQSQPTDNPSDLIPMTALLRLLEEDDDELDDSGDKENLPRITRMPDGIEVLEQRAGVADGQWLLQVRCQCGRRWFEVEAIPATTCPRCGLLVYVNVAVPMSPA